MTPMKKEQNPRPKRIKDFKRSSAWLKHTEQGLVVRFWVQPNASQTQISGLREIAINTTSKNNRAIKGEKDSARIKIRLAASPTQGQANRALIAFLSKKLKIPKKQIQLIRGQKSKAKDILFLGMDRKDFQIKLNL